MKRLALDWRTTLLPGARRWSRALGPVGLAGVALLGCAVVLAVQAVPVPGRTANARATADSTRERLEQARERRALEVPAAARLVDAVPAVDRANADLRRIFRAAKNANVSIAKGDYALAPGDDAGPWRRLDVVLPVHDKYPAIKGFVAEVLNDVPNASLSELHIERNASNLDVLDARVRFTLFYQAKP